MPAAAAATITAGTSVAEGLASSAAADAASKAATQASQQNKQLAQQIFSQDQANFNPFIQSGQTATNETLGLLGLGGNPQAAQNAFNQFRNSTNYNFLLNQGLQGVQSANAQSFNSGATMKALNNYAQGMAGNALSGYLGQLNQLSGQGLSGAGTLGSLGQNYVQQVAGFNNNAAGIRASADIAQGTAFNNALSGVQKAVTPGVSSFIGNFFNPAPQAQQAQLASPSSYQLDTNAGLDSSGWNSNLFAAG